MQIFDPGQSQAAETVAALLTMHEPARWNVRWELAKFHGDDTDAPFEVIDGVGNLLTTNGANDLLNALIGGSISGGYFSNANAYIGVGDGNGSVPTPAVGDTDLTAPTNKLRKAMDATYPSVSGATLTFRATFATSDANFNWREWGVFNAASGGRMLNHKGVDLGTKTSAASWQFAVTITLS